MDIVILFSTRIIRLFCYGFLSVVLALYLAEIGLTEGNIFQGELSLEQLFFNRPVPGWARYRTPVKDLWMCGSATHPGGGIMGAPGRIAALEYLKEKKRGRRQVA